jgi:hypothetical protein
VLKSRYANYAGNKRKTVKGNDGALTVAKSGAFRYGRTLVVGPARLNQFFSDSTERFVMAER